MPISSPAANNPFPRRERGLTLVEMLVVLAIIAVIAGAVTLSMGSAGRGGSRGEAQRLAARLALAADEAMVTDRVIGFEWDEKGYRFVDWVDGKWLPDDAAALEPYRFPAGVSLDRNTAAAPVVIGADGGGTPLALRLRGGSSNGWTIRFDGARAQVTPAA